MYNMYNTQQNPDAPTTKPLCRKEQSEDVYDGNRKMKITFAVATGGMSAKMRAATIQAPSLLLPPAASLSMGTHNSFKLVIMTT